jgi:hypothetical protein
MNSYDISYIINIQVHDSRMKPQWVNEPSNFKTFSMNATCG